MSVTSIHQFSEKVALITDITDPVGRATALQLALQGSYVIGGVPKGSPGDGGLAAELRSLGTLALTAEYTPETEDGAKKLVDTVNVAFGRLDLLVNCLKIGSDSAFPAIETVVGESSNEDISDPITKTAIGLMSQRPKPRMVIVFDWPEGEFSENGGRKDLTGKFLKTVLSRVPGNFKVNAVEIGRVPTAIPKPDDAARVILFLLSGEAAAVNGQSILLTRRQV